MTSPLLTDITFTFLVCLLLLLLILLLILRELFVSTFYLLFSLFFFLHFHFSKIINSNEDAYSVVRYHFKEPFVTKALQILPDVDTSQAVYLRTEIYGCRLTPGNGIIIVY